MTGGQLFGILVAVCLVVPFLAAAMLIAFGGDDDPWRFT